MGGDDPGTAGQVGDGTGDLDDAGIGAGAQTQAVDDFLQHLLAGLVQLAVLLHLLGIHLGVAEDAAAGEALPLQLPGLQDPRGDDLRGFRLAAADEGRCLHGMHPQLDVDPVHDGAAELREVADALTGRAGAAVPFPVVAAGAGIGRRDQHEGGRIFHLAPEPGDGYFPVFQRAPEGFQHGFRRLTEFIDEQHAVGGQRDFPGEDVVPASPSQQGRFGGRDVRSPEGTRADEARLAGGASGHGVHLRGDGPLFEGHRREDARQRLRDGTLPAPGRADQQ